MLQVRRVRVIGAYCALTSHVSRNSNMPLDRYESRAIGHKAQEGLGSTPHSKGGMVYVIRRSRKLQNDYY